MFIITLPVYSQIVITDCCGKNITLVDNEGRWVYNLERNNTLTLDKVLAPLGCKTHKERNECIDLITAEISKYKEQYDIQVEDKVQIMRDYIGMLKDADDEDVKAICGRLGVVMGNPEVKGRFMDYDYQVKDSTMNLCEYITYLRNQMLSKKTPLTICWSDNADIDTAFALVSTQVVGLKENDENVICCLDKNDVDPLFKNKRYSFYKKRAFIKERVNFFYCNKNDTKEFCKEIDFFLRFIPIPYGASDDICYNNDCTETLLDSVYYVWEVVIPRIKINEGGCDRELQIADCPMPEIPDSLKNSLNNTKYCRIPIKSYFVPGLGWDYLSSNSYLDCWDKKLESYCDNVENSKKFPWKSTIVFSATLGSYSYSAIEAFNYNKYCKKLDAAYKLEDIDNIQMNINKHYRQMWIAAGTGTLIWLSSDLWIHLIDSKECKNSPNGCQRCNNNENVSLILKPSFESDFSGGVYSGMALKLTF